MAPVDNQTSDFRIITLDFSAFSWSCQGHVSSRTVRPHRQGGDHHRRRRRHRDRLRRGAVRGGRLRRHRRRQRATRPTRQLPGSSRRATRRSAPSSMCAPRSPTEAMAQAAVDAFGGIDILINNAAIMTDLPPFGLANMPYDEWDRVMNVNFRGPLLCTQAVVPVDGGARWRPNRQRAVGRRLHAGRDLRRQQVRPARPDDQPRRPSSAGATSTSTPSRPGWSTTRAATPRCRRTRRSATRSPRRSRARRRVRPRTWSATLLLLCSRAGDWITGQTILVDGGWITRL